MMAGKPLEDLTDTGELVAGALAYIVQGGNSRRYDLGTNLAAKQPLDADLTALAALSDTGVLYYRSAPNTWSPVAIGSSLSLDTGTLNISNNGVGNTKLADMAATRVKARATASTGDPEDIQIGQGLELDTGSLRTKQKWSIDTDTGGLKLLNDESAPGGSKYYGTSAGGTKGYHTLGSAALVLILAQTASNSSAIDFTQANAASAFNGTYDRLVLYVSAAKPATDDVEFWIRIGTGAGPTYQTSGYKYIETLIANSDGLATQGSAAATRITIGNSGANGAVGNASGETFNAKIEFDMPSASNFMEVMFDAAYHRADDQPTRVIGSGNYATVGAVTAIRCMFESGNISSGTFALYGVVKS